MELRTIVVGPLRCNCYVLWNEKDAAVVIDPGAEPERILRVLATEKVRPRLVLNTHGHFDHVGGVAPLQRTFGAPYRVHAEELPIMAMAPPGSRMWGILIPEAPTPDGFLEADRVLTVGSLEIRAIHTPGHTPGSTCFHVPAAGSVFTGDTLFLGSIGRSDFPGGDGDQLVRSIRERLLTLPGETKVYPGHGPDTTIADEVDTNPFLA